MVEYIDKAVALSMREPPKSNRYYQTDNLDDAYEQGWDEALSYIEKIPAADVAPVRYGRWIDNHCTACGMMPMGDDMWKNYDCEPPLFERFMDYCPSCGAKMQEQINEKYQ